MSPEKHLAAILSAWHETNGFHISFELKEALETAEQDFDGVEVDNDQQISFPDARIREQNMTAYKEEIYDLDKRIDYNRHSFRREVRPDDRTE